MGIVILLALVTNTTSSMLRLYFKSPGNPTHKFIYENIIPQYIVAVKIFKTTYSFSLLISFHHQCRYRQQLLIYSYHSSFQNTEKAYSHLLKIHSRRLYHYNQSILHHCILQATDLQYASLSVICISCF